MQALLSEKHADINILEGSLFLADKLWGKKKSKAKILFTKCSSGVALFLSLLF